MKKLIAKLATLPQYSKNDNFTMALVDYLYNELKLNGISVRRENSYVKVALSNKYEDKFEHIIIDCCDGKMYLRGKDCKDKRWGKLSKFNLKRKSDAYVCANYNARRIINRIKNLENKMMEKVEMIQKEKLSLASSTSIDDEVNYYLYDLDTDEPKEMPIGDININDIVVDDKNSEPVEVDIIDLDNDEVTNLDAEDEIIELDDDVEAYPYYELDENDVVEEYPFYDLDDYDGEIEAYIFVEPLEKEVMDELVRDLMEGNYIELSDEDVVDVYPYYDLEDGEVEAYPYYELDENDVDEAYTFDNLSEEEQTELLKDLLNDNCINVKAAEEMPLDKLMAHKNEIFDEYFKEFLNSDELKNYIKGNKVTHVLTQDVETVLRNIKSNYREDMANFVRQKLNIDDDKALDDRTVYDVFNDYLYENDKKISKEVFDAIKVPMTEMAENFAEQLANNNDQVGRKIETNNVDMIDTMNRSKPFLYVNGKIYIGKDGETHTDIMRELDMEVEGKRRPRLSELPEDVSFGFGHISNGIGFVDENARNCTAEEVAKAAIKEDGIKKVYTSPSGDKYITRLANNRLALVYGE